MQDVGPSELAIRRVADPRTEGDLEEAWRVADELGVGHAWRPLAEASIEQRPVEAAHLFMADIEGDLSPASSLLHVREILEGAGHAAAFDEYLRARFHRRPSLMAALDRVGLVPPG